MLLPSDPQFIYSYAEDAPAAMRQTFCDKCAHAYSGFGRQYCTRFQSPEYSAVDLQTDFAVTERCFGKSFQSKEKSHA